MALQHGWGWDAGGWDAWRRQAPPDWRIAAGERGYFGAVPTPLAPAPVVVCHSFGLHLAPAELLSRAALLVVLGGFERFHGDERSRAALRRMRRRLSREPNALLRDFRSACHAPRPAPAALCGDGAVQAWRADLLQDDLERLDRDEGLTAVPAGRALILHGRADAVVAPERAEALQAAWPGSSLVLHPEGGHALHVDEAAWCWERVSEAWDAL